MHLLGVTTQAKQTGLAPGLEKSTLKGQIEVIIASRGGLGCHTGPAVLSGRHCGENMKRTWFNQDVIARNTIRSII